jgi:hypothetical protein
MGKANQKKRRNRYVQAVIGEHAQDLSGKPGVKRWMKLDEPAFRADVLTMKRDIARAGGEVADHIAPGWTPLFERYRQERTSGVLQEQYRLRAGTSQAVELLPSMDRLGAAATVHTGMQLVRTCLERTDLFLFTPSAFAMSAYLLAGEASLSDALLPHAPVWIEYDRARRMRADLPDITTSAFWFSNPFQVETLLSALASGHLPPGIRRLASSLSTAREREAWLLEVYNSERGAVAVLQYHVPSARWEFALGHESVCPHRLCICEKLEQGGGFIVPCEGCSATLALYSRVFATSLLLTSGALRTSREEEEPLAQATRTAPPTTAQPQASAVPPQQAQAAHPGSEAEEAPPSQGAPVVPPEGGKPATAPAPRSTSHGYTIIEFDASVRPRSRPLPRTHRGHWSEGRRIIDLAEANELDIEIDAQAIVLVDLSYSGITRKLRSPYFRHKQGQVIEVRDFTVPRVKMTYAAYKRRQENRRMTKVTAARFRGVAAAREANS